MLYVWCTVKTVHQGRVRLCDTRTLRYDFLFHRDIWLVPMLNNYRRLPIRKLANPPNSKLFRRQPPQTNERLLEHLVRLLVAAYGLQLGIPQTELSKYNPLLLRVRPSLEIPAHTTIPVTQIQLC